jgi:hypothetical protein
MKRKALRWPLAVLLGTAVVAGIPLALGACDKEVNRTKSTTTKTTETPSGTKKTTETTEKKEEVERKNPPN